MGLKSQKIKPLQYRDGKKYEYKKIFETDRKNIEKEIVKEKMMEEHWNTIHKKPSAPALKKKKRAGK